MLDRNENIKDALAATNENMLPMNYDAILGKTRILTLYSLIKA